VSIGYALITYYDITNKDLRYTGPSGNRLLGDGGSASSVIADDQGLPLICAFMTISSPTMSFISWNGVSWNKSLFSKSGSF
jgi:hypothetical protein